jgi:hypothetical protein
MSSAVRFAVPAVVLAGLLGPPRAAAADPICVVVTSAAGPPVSVCVPFGDPVRCDPVGVHPVVEVTVCHPF